MVFKKYDHFKNVFLDRMNTFVVMDKLHWISAELVLIHDSI